VGGGDNLNVLLTRWQQGISVHLGAGLGRVSLRQLILCPLRREVVRRNHPKTANLYSTCALFVRTAEKLRKAAASIENKCVVTRLLTPGMKKTTLVFNAALRTHRAFEIAA